MVIQPDGRGVEFCSGNVENYPGRLRAELAKEDAQSKDGTLAIWSVFLVFFLKGFFWRPSQEPERQQQSMKRQAGAGRPPWGRFAERDQASILTISGFLPQMSIRRIETKTEGSSINVMAMKLVVASDRFCQKTSQRNT